MSMGCAISSPSQYWDSTFSFSGHAEDVFRRQNKMTSEILMMSEEDVDEEKYSQLLRAEQNLQAACKLLNEYAVRERDGLETGFVFKREVKNSIEMCEKSIEEAKSVLDDGRHP